MCRSHLICLHRFLEALRQCAKTRGFQEWFSGGSASTNLWSELHELSYISSYIYDSREARGFHKWFSGGSALTNLWSEFYELSYVSSYIYDSREARGFQEWFSGEFVRNGQVNVCFMILTKTLMIWIWRTLMRQFVNLWFSGESVRYGHVNMCLMKSSTNLWSKYHELSGEGGGGGHVNVCLMKLIKKHMIWLSWTLKRGRGRWRGKGAWVSEGSAQCGRVNVCLIQLSTNSWSKYHELSGEGGGGAWVSEGTSRCDHLNVCLSVPKITMAGRVVFGL